MPAKNISFNPAQATHVDSVTIHAMDVRLSRKLVDRDGHFTHAGGGVRGKVTGLSRQSRTRLLFKARNTPSLGYMLTFTYPGEQWAESSLGGNYLTDGKCVKYQLTKLR